MNDLLPEGVNRAVGALTVELELEPVPPADVVSGAPEQGIVELGSVGGSDLGVWELRGGTTTDTEVDEIFIVLSGGASIELLEVPGAPDQTGRVVHVGAGDAMRLVAGTRAQWTVPDHIRKVYVAAG